MRETRTTTTDATNEGRQKDTNKGRLEEYSIIDIPTLGFTSRKTMPEVNNDNKQTRTAGVNVRH